MAEHDADIEISDEIENEAVRTERYDNEEDSQDLVESKLQFDFVVGFRANSQLLYTSHDKQLYRRCTKYRQKYFWYRCRVKDCKARVFYNFQSNKCFVKSNAVAHSHGSQESTFNECQLRMKIKNECKSLSGAVTNRNTVADVFYSHLREQSDIALNLSTMQRSLCRYKSSALLQSPRTAAELKLAFQREDVMSLNGRTLANDTGMQTDFFRTVFVSEQFSYAVFASQKIIDQIKEKIPVVRRKYAMDATFKVCPYGEFKHLLIIHIEYIESTIPFIFVLMSRKTEMCYTHLFEYIEKNVHSLSGESFMTDYEKAMRNALKNGYPESKHYTCWFHFCQAVKRSANLIPGFPVEIRKNVDARDIYCRFLCLPLLPVDVIKAAFDELRMEAQNFNERFFRPFLTYYETQWLRNEGPVNISVYKKPARTTNALKAYNGALGKKIAKKGHFFKFLGVLLTEESMKSYEFTNLTLSSGSSKKRKRSRDVKIDYATEKYEKHIFTPDIFLRRVVYKNAEMFAPLSKFDDVGENEDDIDQYLSATNNDADEAGPSGINERRTLDVARIYCSVCLIAPKEVVMMPCKHLYCCNTCFDILEKNAKEVNVRASRTRKKSVEFPCPMCRRCVKADQVLRVLS